MWIVTITNKLFITYIYYIAKFYVVYQNKQYPLNILQVVHTAKSSQQNNINLYISYIKYACLLWCRLAPIRHWWLNLNNTYTQSHTPALTTH